MITKRIIDLLCKIFIIISIYIIEGYIIVKKDSALFQFFELNLKISVFGGGGGVPFLCVLNVTLGLVKIRISLYV